MAKSYLAKKETKTIEVFGEKLQVRKTGFKDTRKAMDAATTVIGNTAKIDTSLVGILRVIYAIESWTLVDENDKPLPITLETFDDVLDEEFVGEIMQAVQDFQGTQGLEEQEKN